jgi:carbamoylphosphate synthase large subunit
VAKDRKSVVLVGCGEERYRRYLLEQLATEYDVILLIDNQPTWQHSLVIQTIRVDNFQPDTLSKIIADLKLSRRIDGIVCWDERYAIAAADVATKFGLPSAGEKGIRGCRDKALCRKLFSALNIPQPKSKYCETLLGSTFEFTHTAGFHQSHGFGAGF